MKTFKVIDCIAICLIAIDIVVFTLCFVKDNNKKNIDNLHYGLSYPAPYVITYRDGHNDTVQVWKDKYDGDCIKMNNKHSYIKYIPYDIYDEAPSKYVKKYDVVKYKKL